MSVTLCYFRQATAIRPKLAGCQTFFASAGLAAAYTKKAWQTASLRLLRAIGAYYFLVGLQRDFSGY